MTNFDEFVSRHGEPAVLAIIENWERHSGVQTSAGECLSRRWQVLMQGTGVDRKAA